MKPRRLLPAVVQTATALLVACGGDPPAPATAATAPPAVEEASPLTPQTRVIDLGPMRIDGLYRSMDGPHQRVPFDAGGVDWITGFTTEVIDSETGRPFGDEFFCHSQLQLGNLTRLLVTATGTADIRFPDGFGMPLRAILGGMPARWADLSLLGMVLNNHDPDLEREVLVRITLDYLSDAQARARGLKKLFKVGIPMHMHKAEVLEGDPPRPAEVELYKGLTGHWMVPPGPQRIVQRYRDIVPVPSTVHYALVHLHNHGREMRLVDVTEGRELWRTAVVYEPERTQILEIPGYSDPTGFRIYPDHEYQVEALYVNTSDRAVDAMASMYLYYRPDGDVDISYPGPPPRNDPGHN